VLFIVRYRIYSIVLYCVFEVDNRHELRGHKWKVKVNRSRLQLRRCEGFQRSRSLHVVVRPSVVCLFVTSVHSTEAIEIFGNVSMLFSTLAIRCIVVPNIQGGSE